MMKKIFAVYKLKSGAYTFKVATSNWAYLVMNFKGKLCFIIELDVNLQIATKYFDIVYLDYDELFQLKNCTNLVVFMQL